MSDLGMGGMVGTLVSLPWIVYGDLLRHGGFVSDDIVGIATYHGTLRKPVPRDSAMAAGSPPWPEGKLDLSWGNLLTWARWHLGKVYNPAHKKDPKQPPWVASPTKHHALSLTLASATAVLAWAFLSRLVGERVAFLAVVLWIVHPLAVQVIGWISGIGYLGAAFWMLLGLNWAQWTLDRGWLHDPLLTLAAVGGYGVCQGLAGRFQFTSIAVVAILAWLRWWVFLVPALGMAAFEVSQTILTAVIPRITVFRQQQMDASTRLRPGKLIVVCKTWYYYLRLALWPKRLGLYHVYGYHYPLPETEQEDRYFWWGLGLLVAWGTAAWCVPPPLSLGFLWYAAYLIFVLNWITVHQFVTERYVWIPVLGICLLVSAWLPLWTWAFLVGLALMRTWVHLPTYYNEVQFYQSNLWNFPSSEVAVGNLGVSYLRAGLVGSAVDAWQIGTRMNAEYDVNWYNLYSTFKTQGQLDLARTFLVRAISSPTCHFPAQWTQELTRFDLERDFLQEAAKIPDLRARLLWMRANLTRAIGDPQVPYKDLWQDVLKKTEAELAKLPPVVAAPSVPVAATPAPVPAASALPLLPASLPTLVEPTSASVMPLPPPLPPSAPVLLPPSSGGTP